MLNRRERPWVAALLALYPGLGHLYLREWLRSLLWFGLVVTSATLVIPESAGPRTASLDALVAASQQVPSSALAVLLGIVVLSMLDAYWLAVDDRDTDAPHHESCPACGKETDPELDFCHWCTTELVDERAA